MLRSPYMSKNSQNKLPSDPVVLITGGSGFLGKSVVAEIFAEDSVLHPKEVRLLDLVPYTGDYTDRIQFISGDIRDKGTLNKAFNGVDLVIHSAAIIDWGLRDESEVLDVNLRGTENVIRACLDQGVNGLVFTSSLDAVYTGRPLVDIDEDQPYPTGKQNAYCRSKTEGEKLVLKAHGDKLKTCVLRPSDIYGEADPYHIDPLIEMSENGFYMRLGDGSSKCQHVYVGNMAHAHLLAGEALLKGDEHVGGNAYFITDGPGKNFFLFFDEIIRRAGYRIWPKNLWLPKSIAYPLASLTELFALILKPFKKIDVKFNRFAVAYTCNDFTFSAGRAKNDFGYSPKYELEECLNRTAAYYRKK